jgi:hypothetical protein
MNKTSTSLLIACAVLPLLGGCASPTPNYDMRFGEAVRQSRLQQTLNPDAGATAGPVSGMDAKSAHEATVRYQDSFKSPPPVVNVINIGGSTAASQ